jgi:hypothetical protein
MPNRAGAAANLGSAYTKQIWSVTGNYDQTSTSKMLKNIETVILDLESMLLLTEENGILVHIAHALQATVLVVFAVSVVGIFPGHSEGKWWPLYIPEYYGGRNSQHLLDPYR